MDKSRGLANPGRGCINVPSLPSLVIGRDYLVQPVSKLGFSTVPLLGEPVIKSPASNPSWPWRTTNRCGINDVKDLGVDCIFAIAPNY